MSDSIFIYILIGILALTNLLTIIVVTILAHYIKHYRNCCLAVGNTLYNQVKKLQGEQGNER